MNGADVFPTLQEILELTRSELTSSVDDGDAICECGCAALDLLHHDPDLALKFAYQKLHDVPYKEVKKCWRRLYVDAALWQVLGVVERRKTQEEEEQKETEDEDWITKVVKILDMSLILTGAPAREEVVELWFSALEGELATQSSQSTSHLRAAKRRKLESCASSHSYSTSLPQTFPTALSDHSPRLVHPITRATTPPSLTMFQYKVSSPLSQTPLIIPGALEHWPALHERPWNTPQYLLDRTLGGRRLVPVEVGRSYTDKGWSQKILSFGEFMQEYMLTASNEATDDDDDQNSNNQEKKKPQTGYLAQHDLFAQIPSLRSDISVPDYCYTTPAPAPPSASAPLCTTPIAPVARPLEEPLLNAWFGPASTISPLHTDPYHNVLAQVVGYKYMRLYAPDETARMYPRGVEEGGVDMSNTSTVDLDVAMRVWPEISCWKGGGGDGNVVGDEEEEEEERKEYKERFSAFRDARYIEGILGPGECLYIPVGWWHYVRSLTPSFSVSFWFN